MTVMEAAVEFVRDKVCLHASPDTNIVEPAVACRECVNFAALLILVDLLEEPGDE